MADLVIYGPAMLAIVRGQIDLDDDPIAAALVCGLSTCGTEGQAGTVADFTTLDEYDGSSYSRTSLANRVVSNNSTLKRIQLAADPVAFGAIGAGSRPADGLLIVKTIDGAGADIPIAFQRFVSAVQGDGSAYLVQWPNSTGHALHFNYPGP